MLSKFAVAASLAMLCEGAIELALSKVSRFSSNNLSQFETARNGSLVLGGGEATNHHAYITEVMIGKKNYRLLCDTGSSDLLVVGYACVTYKRGATCNPTIPPTGYCTAAGPDHQPNAGISTGIAGSNCYGTPGQITFAKYYVYQTNVTFAGLQASNQYIGYIHQQTVGMWGEGEIAVDGILGLAYSSLSSIYSVTNGKGETLMSTISQENDLPNAFAMCFDPSGTGGKMVIGGGEQENMQFTPLILDEWYTVNMTSVRVGEETLEYTAGLETIVDSGTTNLIVPGEVLQAFAAQICPILSEMGESCHVDQNHNKHVPQIIMASPEQIAMMPDIVFNLPGVSLVVSPQSYFRNVGRASEYENYYIYGIGSDGYYKSPSGNVAIILGDVALMGHWVYFDTVNGRVGFNNVDNCNQHNNPIRSTAVPEQAQATKVETARVTAEGSGEESWESEENGVASPYSLISIWASVLLPVVMLIAA